MLLIGAILISGNIRLSTAIAAAAVAIARVLVINRFAGNYGWAVLFQTSFIGGPAEEIAAHITIAQYLRVFAMGVEAIFSQAAIWILLALAAWKNHCRRDLLAVVGLAAFGHFVLFPSGETRFLSGVF